MQFLIEKGAELNTTGAAPFLLRSVREFKSLGTRSLALIGAGWAGGDWRRGGNRIGLGQL